MKNHGSGRAAPYRCIAAQVVARQMRNAGLPALPAGPADHLSVGAQHFLDARSGSVRHL